MLQATTACRRKDTRERPVLYLAFDLGRREWHLGFTTGMAQRPRQRRIQAGDLRALAHEIESARRRFQVPNAGALESCYEAGRDGFWLHRYLESIGVHNHVVDSASIEVKQRAKRVKTDRLDLAGLLRLLIRYVAGERRVWSVVHVPSPEAEDARHLHRELLAIKRDRNRVTNRLKNLLATQGVRLEPGANFEEAVEEARLWNGSPFSAPVRQRLLREASRWTSLSQEIAELEAERRALLRHSDDPAVDQIRRLLQLRGIGINSAWIHVMEFFSWRAFRNRRDVGALAGLTPTPYQSGGSRREQGIGKAGNRHVRWMAIEIAWAWLRYQPQSALAFWYQERFASGGSRIRRIGIVAVARRLLIDLWRYLETGVLPEGALTKA